jgi:hypothetical protein
MTNQLASLDPRRGAAAATLDTAVRTAYGFSAIKDLLAQRLALNQPVAANWHEC